MFYKKKKNIVKTDTNTHTIILYIYSRDFSFWSANSIKPRGFELEWRVWAVQRQKEGPPFKAIMWIVFHMKNARSQKFCDKWQSRRCLEFHRGMQHNLIKKEGLERKSVTWRLAGGLALDESGNSLSHCCQHFLMWTLRLIGGPCQVPLRTFPAIPSPTVLPSTLQSSGSRLTKLFSIFHKNYLIIIILHASTYQTLNVYNNARTQKVTIASVMWV